jgi:hypothetical protein
MLFDGTYVETSLDEGGIISLWFGDGGINPEVGFRITTGPLGGVG